MKILSILSFMVFCTSMGLAQNTYTVRKTLVWDQAVKVPNAAPLNFEGAIDRNDSPFPSFEYAIPNLPKGTKMSVNIVSIQYETVVHPLLESYGADLPAEVQTSAEAATAARVTTGFVHLMPFRRLPNGSFERVTSFELRVTTSPAPSNPNFSPTATESVLANGNVYKIAVTQNGMHKLDYNFLKNTLGISNLDQIDPRNIQLYGNGGGALPERCDIPRFDDLKENRIKIVGEGDGKFDAGDYILFYGQEAHKWSFDNTRFVRATNPYSDKNYYFIKIGTSNGRRIDAPRASLAVVTDSTTTYDALQHYEKDDVNVMTKPEETGLGKGAGRRMFDNGYFKYTNERIYNFNFPNKVAGSNVRLTANAAIRTVGSVSSLGIKANNAPVMTLSTGSVGGGFLDYYALDDSETVNFPTSGDNVELKLNFTRGNATAVAWLDYLTLQTRCNLQFANGQLLVRDANTMQKPSVAFLVAGANANVKVWDVTDPTEAVEQGTNLNGNVLRFGFEANNFLKEMVLYDGSVLLAAEAVGKVTNQNLHGLPTPNMVILYNPSVGAGAAQTLAAHRRSFSGLEVATININDVYNEFSSGRPDITAIRDMARVFRNRADGDKFRFLLLMGDASYDFKNRQGKGGNVIPTYETYASFNSVSAYATDDYYGLLDDDEGAGIETGSLDIAIGRLPIHSNSEANDIVAKVMRYDNNRDMLGDWINRATFVADDEDGNTHLEQLDPIGNNMLRNTPRFNVDKIYADAYNQINSAGGNRFPEVNQAINRTLFKGSWMVNYAGHGGPEGWAQERIMNEYDLAQWNNNNAMPLIITASCSVAYFDDPNELSIGEKMFLKKTGGAIGLYSTIRPVDSYNNRTLNTNVISVLTDSTRTVTMGEALQFGKNIQNTGSNGRKFLLIGDPAQYLARPEYKAVTTRINGLDLAQAAAQGLDTLRALQNVVIEGEIRDNNNQLLTNFNGNLLPTLYDKETTRYTLGQDAGSDVVGFLVRNSIIFKGNATVINGKFRFNFVVPRDIDYRAGLGKMSYYARQNNNLADAGGYDMIKVGGSNGGGNTGAQSLIPPVVEAFINDDKFVSGGTTNDKPLLYLKLSDNLGINTAGAGIGHDITAVIDGNTAQTKVLNDFFQTERDSSRRGTVRFPLEGLAKGKHTIKVKAWDVENNSGEDQIDFVVAENGEVKLSNVLNYPNPFVNNTNFWFEHNLIDTPIETAVQIFTVSGKLVKTIERNMIPTTFRVDDINWDGNDDMGDRLANGVYLYKISVAYNDEKGNKKNTTSDFQKLVLLK
jgi:Peptidase family C25